METIKLEKRLNTPDLLKGYVSYQPPQEKKGPNGDMQLVSCANVDLASIIARDFNSVRSRLSINGVKSKTIDGHLHGPSSENYDSAFVLFFEGPTCGDPSYVQDGEIKSGFMGRTRTPISKEIPNVTIRAHVSLSDQKYQDDVVGELTRNRGYSIVDANSL